jgi:hypothetical protein
MTQTTTRTATAAAKIEPVSRRSVLLLAVLPLSLLLIGSGFAPLLTHLAQASGTPGMQVTLEEQARNVTSAEIQLNQMRRMVALDTVERLEKEVRQGRGKVQISALELVRLRKALRGSE